MLNTKIQPRRLIRACVPFARNVQKIKPVQIYTPLSDSKPLMQRIALPLGLHYNYVSLVNMLITLEPHGIF